jgi:hypothetical protein
MPDLSEVLVNTFQLGCPWCLTKTGKGAVVRATMTHAFRKLLESRREITGLISNDLEQQQPQVLTARCHCITGPFPVGRPPFGDV